jgi:rRNA-processing protein FCF1
MKYLVDENMSKPDKFIKEHPEFENVKHSIGIGAGDEVIMNKAHSEEYVIITKDIGLTLRALIHGVKVWYYDDKENGYRLVASRF